MRKEQTRAPQCRPEAAATFAATEPTLRRLLAAMGLPAATIDDVLQDAFVRLAESKREFASAAHARNWLVRVAVNLAKQGFRKTARHERAVKIATAHDVAEPAQAEQATVENDRRAAVHAALEKLDVETRALLVLRYFLDWPIADIAATMDKPAGTVRRVLFEARKELAQVLEEDA